jgi:hypothetical protein
MQVLKYLARYTHRVAISNNRILAFKNGRVCFRWKDRAENGRHKETTVDAVEFIRRFLLHVLPKGFTRIRHFGFLANRNRKKKLALVRDLLAIHNASQAHDVRTTRPSPSSEQDQHEQHRSCPKCDDGTLLVVGTLPAAPTSIDDSS